MEDLFVFYSGMDKDILNTVFIKDNCCLFIKKDNISDFIKKFVFSNTKNKKIEINYFVFKDGIKTIIEDESHMVLDRGIQTCKQSDDFDLIIINCRRYQNDGKYYKIVHRIVRYRDYTTVNENEIKHIIM